MIDKGLWVLTYALAIPVFTTFLVSLGGVNRQLEFKDQAEEDGLSVGYFLPFVDDIQHSFGERGELGTSQITLIAITFMALVYSFAGKAVGLFMHSTLRRRIRFLAVRKSLLSVQFIVPFFTFLVSSFSIVQASLGSDIGLLMVPFMGVAVVESSDR